MKKSLSACALLTIAACSLQAQTAGPFDFNTSGQLSGNFRSNLANSTNFASEVSVGGQDFVQVNATGATSYPWIGIYDTTPLDTSDAAQTFSGPFTLTLDVSTGQANGSFGVFLFDASNASNNLLAIFNLDSGAGVAGNEQIRFWRDTSMTVGTVSNIYTAASGLFTGTNGTAHGGAGGTDSWITDAAARDGATIDTSSPFEFYTLTFAYDPIAATLRVASPSFSATLNIPAADVISNPAIALRVNDSSLNDANSARIDNFAVVPEPMTASLFGVAGMALALRRRRA